MEWDRRATYSDNIFMMPTFPTNTTVDMSQLQSTDFKFNLGRISLAETRVDTPRQPAVAVPASNTVVPSTVEALAVDEDDDDDEEVVQKAERAISGHRENCLTQAVKFEPTSFASSPLGTQLSCPSPNISHSRFASNGGVHTSTALFSLIPASVPPKVEDRSVVDRFDRPKVDRKRERNRVAAQKCRQRKLQLISDLNCRVEALTKTNTQLEATADRLRRELNSLKNQINLHVNAGCRIANFRL